MKALEAARYLIYLSGVDELSRGITPLKLQKLLYYGQGFSFIWDKKPLFEDEIQAWQYGPVVPEVYDYFKKYKSSFIPLSEGDYSVGTEEERETLHSIWDEYKDYSASQLVGMTHMETPWIEAFNGTNGVIESVAIKKYFETAYN